MRLGGLGELKRSPDPLAALRGPTSKRRGREGREREGKGRGNLLQGVRGLDAPDCYIQSLSPSINLLAEKCIACIHMLSETSHHLWDQMRWYQTAVRQMMCSNELMKLTDSNKLWTRHTAMTPGGRYSWPREYTEDSVISSRTDLTPYNTHTHGVSHTYTCALIVFSF